MRGCLSAGNAARFLSLKRSWRRDAICDAVMLQSIRQCTCGATATLAPRRSRLYCFSQMLDRTFAKWWLQRVGPFIDVPPEKLAAERDAMERQQEFNQNYERFLKGAVFP